MLSRARWIALSFVLAAMPTVGAKDPLEAGKLAELIDGIRTEATRSNNGPGGRPLPLVAHWNRGSKPTGFSPVYQMELIRAGHHLMPWFEFPRPNATPEKSRYYSGEYLKAFKEVAELKLPFTLVGTQWEMILGKSKYPGGPYKWKALPPEENPLVINLEGEIDPRKGISPFGPTKPWEEVGKVWVDSPLMKQLQTWYPDPPLVIFLSNNEAHTLRWKKRGDLETISKRYLDKYGKGQSNDFKRKVVGDGWIERYKALFARMREGLEAPAWKDNVRFVGYGVVGPMHMGRWSGWPVYSLHCKGRICPGPYAWDGGSPSYYTHNWDASTDFRVHGPQISFMNGVMILRRLYRDRPDFWWEFSVWDGNAPGKKNDKWVFYEKHGGKYTPERHGSYVEFGMWLTRPRLVRPWRGYLDTRERVGAYFEAIVKVVDRVWADPVLTRFWRKGKLVPNRVHEHPYQVGIPRWLQDEDRWYLLDTNLDPKRPWKLDTEIPVFSLAYVMGKVGDREWLVYARSPLQNRSGVQITIPAYKAIKVDVPIDGAFYHVAEASGRIVPVGR